MIKENDLQSISNFLNWWLSNQRLSPNNQREFDAYYRSYQRSFTSYIRRQYANQTKEVEELLSHFNDTPNILEIGCGCGTEALWLATQGAQVLGIDLSTSRLDVAIERKKVLSENIDFDFSVEFKFADIFELDTLSNRVDIVWMEQAFHHIEPRAELPSILFKLLKPGGYIVISETNAWNPFIQFKLFRQRGFRTIRHFTDHHGQKHVYGNERITVPSAVICLFRKNGFDLISKRNFRIFPNSARAEKYSWIEDVIPEYFSILFTHYNIVLRKP